MSVPNVGHLEAQRGGCCTVMPYFVGNILELPLTTTQDYALFNYLDSYSIELWQLQATLIMKQHGLISFLVHPDYIIKPREQEAYKFLLSYLKDLRVAQGLWIPTPGQLNHWWRQRAKMRLVEDGDRIWIEGEGCEQARIAYASEINGELTYALQQTPNPSNKCFASSTPT